MVIRDNEVTLELGSTKSPPYSQIPGYWDDNRESMLAYMETCLIGVRGIVTDVDSGAPLAATVTVVGLQFAGLLGGAVVIEWVFAWPGIGWLGLQGIYQRDYAVLQATVLLVAAAFVIINIAVDIIYAVVDPRIKYD